MLACNVNYWELVPMIATILRIVTAVPQVVEHFEAMVRAVEEATDNELKIKAVVQGLEDILNALKQAL